MTYVFISRQGQMTWNTDCAGAPSKAHIRHLVKIQHEERLAPASELNPTSSLVTDCYEAGGKGYQATTGSEGYKPRNSDDLGSRLYPRNGRQQSQHRN